VWSPGVQKEAFYGDDFSGVLEMLDKADLIYTYNGIEFDLPRLAKHCKRELGPWMRKTVDPLYMMKHTMGLSACKKLNDLLLVNGFEPKSGSGLQAIEFWHNGEREKLSSYCMDDARLTYLFCENSCVQWGPRWRVHLRRAKVLEFS
jgi:predicted PolB exonuclease-like 3'-5' exonuclease